MTCLIHEIIKSNPIKIKVNEAMIGAEAEGIIFTHELS
jgi:hypothetical protein